MDIELRDYTSKDVNTYSQMKTEQKNADPGKVNVTTFSKDSSARRHWCGVSTTVFLVLTGIGLGGFAFYLSSRQLQDIKERMCTTKPQSQVDCII